MATKSVDPADIANDAEEWETINVGLGREWDLEHDGVLVGIFVNQGEMEVDDKQNGGKRMTAYFQFDVNGETRFIWGSYQIDLGMGQFNRGDTARIEYTGTESFNGDRGPQQVKNYSFKRRLAN